MAPASLFASAQVCFMPESHRGAFCFSWLSLVSQRTRGASFTLSGPECFAQGHPTWLADTSAEENTKSRKEAHKFLGDFEPGDRWEVGRDLDVQVPFLFSCGLRTEEMLASLNDRRYMVATGAFRSCTLGSMGADLFLLKGMMQGHHAKGLVGGVVSTQRLTATTFVKQVTRTFWLCRNFSYPTP